MKRIKIAILTLILVFITTSCITQIIDTKESQTTKLSETEIENKTLEFINKYLIDNNTAKITEINDKSGVYELKVEIEGTDTSTVSYVSYDGELFFFDGLNIKEFEKEMEKIKQQQEEAINIEEQITKEVPKTDKPVVEVFIMTHCPFGTQIQKGFLPVIEKLGDKIDFEFKFCDYSMRGEIEIKEQLIQYCIAETQEDKLITYLQCFLAEEDQTENCLNEVNINKTILDQCISETDEKHEITEKLADQTTWRNGRFPLFPIHQEEVDKYNITGSPTIIINGVEVKTNRDPRSLMQTICNAFTIEIEECQNLDDLSDQTPTPGFGFGESASSIEASCG